MCVHNHDFQRKKQTTKKEGLKQSKISIELNERKTKSKLLHNSAGKNVKASKQNLKQLKTKQNQLDEENESRGSHRKKVAK